jgi:flavodoxin
VRVLVAYISQTGNTKKVAEAIYGEIKAEKEIKPIQDVDSLEEYDLAFIGFPIISFDSDKSAVEFLTKHSKGKKIALFITHGAPEKTPVLDEWFASAKKAASNGELLGLFNCRGELAAAVKEFMEKSGSPNLERMARMDNSQGQPDEVRLERARAFAKNIMSKASCRIAS